MPRRAQGACDVTRRQSWVPHAHGPSRSHLGRSSWQRHRACWTCGRASALWHAWKSAWSVRRHANRDVRGQPPCYTVLHVQENARRLLRLPLQRIALQVRSKRAHRCVGREGHVRGGATELDQQPAEAQRRACMQQAAPARVRHASRSSKPRSCQETTKKQIGPLWCRTRRNERCCVRSPTQCCDLL